MTTHSSGGGTSHELGLSVQYFEFVLPFLSYNEAINCIVEVVSMAGILGSDVLQGLFIRLCTMCEICLCLTIQECCSV